MSWQRMDENTYVDDTLITCAEYQLFIDEMCEQGKYYQPDHWISFQFPQGLAREPILGVRHSDVDVFCKWLTDHEEGEIQFRLPTQEEASIFPLKPIEDTPLGYWVMGSFGRAGFAWIGSVPVDVRNISSVRTPDHLLDRAVDNALALDLGHAFSIKYDPPLDRTIFRINSRDLSRLQGRSQAIKRGLDRAIEYVRQLSRAHNVEREHTLDLFIDLYTLRNRIAGRSPAFEGIRLVKERIR